MFANASLYWLKKKFNQLYSSDVTVLSVLLWSSKEKVVTVADYGKALHITFPKHSVCSFSMRWCTQHPYKIMRGVLGRKTYAPNYLFRF